MSDLMEGAERITEKYRRWSFVAGVVPVPVADVAAVSGVNLKMLSDLSDHYGVEFSESRGKKIVGALLGGVVPTVFAAGYVGSALKAVAGVGTVLGAFTMPVFASAATTGLGRIFIRHFEGGGTLEDFEPEELAASVENAVDKAVEKSGEAPAAGAGEDAGSLTHVKGIGPKLQEVLKNAGIETLDQLAAAEVSDLQAILDEAGSRYRLQDPSNWPDQAKAALGK